MTTQQKKDLDRLLNLEEGLSNWEVEFIDNLDKWWRDRELTEKQIKVLDRLVMEELQ